MVVEEFDLEKYNTGNYDVVTREGKKARIICTNKKYNGGEFIVALVENDNGDEFVEDFHIDGSVNYYAIQDKGDLMLIEKQWMPKEGELFYYIDSINLAVHFDTYDVRFFFHREMADKHNCFKTKEDAEEKLKV